MYREQSVIWLHLISDALIALAYFTIPVSLLRFVRRREDLAFNWMFVCFALFILACGLTHVMNVVAMWTAYYRVDGIVKAITAIASIGTAIALWQLIPAALLLPSPSQLRKANEDLELQIGERKLAEARLRAAHDELEERVRERTVALTEANASERAARAEAEHAGRMKDEFLSTLSHELRTPLNAILGWSQIIKRAPSGSEEIPQGLEVIERNARVQAQIIDDLLDMSRIISGKVRLDIQRLDLAAIVKDVADMMKPTADAKGIRLQAVIDPLHGVSVKGDPSRLRQILWNLLSNAIKFTPKDGKIQLLLERVDSHLEINVTDTGEGIKPEFLPFVFDRFRQADSSSTRRHGGLGLGLSIVKHLVELHGGSVYGKSDGEGKGTTFTIVLPLTVIRSEEDPDESRRHPRSTPAVTSPSEPSVQISGVRVLVVDDEPDARELVKRVLEKSNAKVTAAATADQAIQLLTENRYDVLISDIGMPGKNGYALISAVRQMKPEVGGTIPAIALTAYARTEDRIKAIASGFQMHISKPVEPFELLTMVASAAGRIGPS
jgi:signal transduction histidine kinase/ActR/RegA family two-component response regulator